MPVAIAGGGERDDAAKGKRYEVHDWHRSSIHGNAVGQDGGVQELAEYQEPHSRVVVSLEGDGLVFWSDTDDNGRSIVGEIRIPVADFLAKGEGPWPWYDLSYRRDGALLVLDALGVGPQPRDSTPMLSTPAGPRRPGTRCARSTTTPHWS